MSDAAKLTKRELTLLREIVEWCDRGCVYAASWSPTTRSKLFDRGFVRPARMGYIATEAGRAALRASGDAA